MERETFAIFLNFSYKKFVRHSSLIGSFSMNSIMVLLNIFISNVLLYLSVLHVYWAFGGLWPGKNKQELIDMVFGQGDRFPSRFACLFVATGLLLFAVLPFFWTFRKLLLLGEFEIQFIFWILIFSTIIFITRGILGYIPQITKMWKPIFVYHTKLIYNPLCLFIGSGILVMILFG